LAASNPENRTGSIGEYEGDGVANDVRLDAGGPWLRGEG
jgi:hypothetical protein